MSKMFPVTIQTDSGSFEVILNRAEFSLYRLLKEKEGTLVTIKELMIELELKDENKLRVTKKSLSEKIESYKVITSIYGTGYVLSNKH